MKLRFIRGDTIVHVEVWVIFLTGACHNSQYIMMIKSLIIDWLHTENCILRIQINTYTTYHIITIVMVTKLPENDDSLSPSDSVQTKPKEKEWNLERVKNHTKSLVSIYLDFLGILFFQVLVSIKLSALFLDISNSFYWGYFFFWVRKAVFVCGGVKSCMYRSTLFPTSKSIQIIVRKKRVILIFLHKKQQTPGSRSNKAARGTMKTYAWNCELKKNWRECLLWVNLRWDTRPLKKRVYFLKVV